MSTNRTILETLFEGDSFRSPDQEYEFRSDDFIAVIPQSGERIESREALRDMQKALGNPPILALKRIVGEGDVWVVEATQTYDDSGTYHVCVIVEFDDGKITRETRYYGAPIKTDRT